MASLRVLILDNFVSQGTLGMQSLSEAKALLIDWVRRRSFLLLPTPGTTGWWRPLLRLLVLLSFDFLAAPTEELLLAEGTDEEDDVEATKILLLKMKIISFWNQDNNLEK